VRPARLPLLPLLLAACGGATEPAIPAPSGQIAVEACRGQTGVSERCTLVTEGWACASARCSRLVVVFSGGEQGCATGAGYASVLAGYAAHGYAAACVNAFETSTGSGAAPYVDEADRLDTAVREATTGAWARHYWTGEHLLLEGISHGATAPVVLMARTTLDEQPHWHGSRVTGGCFFDGSYDQAASAALLATGAAGGGACTAPVPHQRWLERYCGPGATGATCDLATNAKALADTVTGAAPAAFAVTALRLFECGSALGACAGDVLPAAPIQALCSALDAPPARSCTFTSLPTDGHLTCHASQYDQCRTWFEGLAGP
jgi:hypothetical protein